MAERLNAALLKSARPGRPASGVRIPPPPLVAALAVVALAGCGGGSGTSHPAGGGRAISAADYKTVVQQVTSQVQRVVANRPAKGAGIAQQAQYAQAMQSAVQQAHDQLARLAPPGAMAKANRLIVAAFGHYADLLGQLVTAARKRNEAAITRIDAQIQAETSKLSSALSQLRPGG